MQAPCASTVAGMALVLLVHVLPGIARGQSPEPPEIVGVRVGLADCYKAGLWTPVDVRLRGGRPLSGILGVTVPDGDGVPSRVTVPVDRPAEVPPDEETTVRLYVRFGRVNSSLQAEFEAGGEVVAQAVFQAAAEPDARHFRPAIESQDLLVTLGGASLGVEQAVLLQRLPKERRPVVARLDNCQQLPTKWYGYEGIDAMVLSTSQPETYRTLKPDDDRIKALDEWIRLGGRLLLCVGSRGEEVLGKGRPLRDLAPGRLEKMESLRQTGALESYCRASTAVPRPKGDERTAMRVPRLVDVTGIVEAREANVPLVVRAPHGLGQIVFLAADLDQTPLAEWPDRALLVSKLLDFPPPHLEEGEHNAPVMHYGYTDMAGQLRSALDRFEGVQSVPFWAVALLVALYIVMIGPVDYFFLRKVVRRMEWTWLSFPLMVAAFCLAAWALAWWFKGNGLRIHQADLIDVDAASGEVRGTTWVNVFSPRTESFKLSLQPRLPDGEVPAAAQVLTCWLGLTGGALGGMNPRAADPMLWSGRYDFSRKLDAMEGVPIQVWSTKSLTARWSAAAGIAPAADLLDRKELLTGTITNTLDFPLTQCILAYQDWVYDLGTIEPGHSVDVGAEANRSELKTLLTGRRLVAEEKDKYHQESTPYDQSSVDVSYILRAMMFFEAAGGQHYTGLGNDYQGFVDLSNLLKTNRAILVAHAPADAVAVLGSELLRDGQPLRGPQDRHTVIYRFVFPVETR
jgi:hypothetical protein